MIAQGNKELPTAVSCFYFLPSIDKVTGLLQSASLRFYASRASMRAERKRNDH
jgi:hypothetical protein